MYIGRALLALAIVVAALAGPSASAREGELSFGVTYEFKSLNPLYISGAERVVLGPLLYSSLLGTAVDGGLRPEVAAIVPTVRNGGISKDGLTIVYHLRRDVRWADGAPLTARDVLFTHAADMSAKNTVIETYGDNLIASITAPDLYTVRVRLRRPFAPFVNYFDRPLLPAHLLAKLDSLDRAAYNTNPVGSGPYRVAEWVRGDHITFVRSQTYWGTQARIPRISLHTIPSEETLAVSLRSHDIDAAISVDPLRVRSLAATPGVRIVKTPMPLFGLMLFNGSDPRLADARVRRAIVLALDRAQIVRKATDGVEETEQPDRALFGWAYDPAVKPWPYDPAAAGRLLDAAGWHVGPDGVRTRDGARLDLILTTQAAHPIFESEANQIAQQAAAVGIHIEVKTYVDQQFFLLTPDGVMWGGKFQIALTAFVGSDDPDPDWLIGCDTAGKPNPYNLTHICMPALQPILRRAVATFDPVARKRDYAVAQRMLHDQVPLVLISQNYLIGVVPSRLHGYSPSTGGVVFWNVASWWLS